MMVEMAYRGIKINVSKELNCMLIATQSLKVVSRVNSTVVCDEGDLQV